MSAQLGEGIVGVDELAGLHLADALVEGLVELGPVLLVHDFIYDTSSNFVPAHQNARESERRGAEVGPACSSA